MFNAAYQNLWDWMLISCFGRLRTNEWRVSITLVVKSIILHVRGSENSDAGSTGVKLLRRDAGKIRFL